jgi:hypothetical protein
MDVIGILIALFAVPFWLLLMYGIVKLVELEEKNGGNHNDGCTF